MLVEVTQKTFFWRTASRQRDQTGEQKKDPYDSEMTLNHSCRRNLSTMTKSWWGLIEEWGMFLWTADDPMKDISSIAFFCGKIGWQTHFSIPFLETNVFGSKMSDTGRVRCFFGDQPGVGCKETDPVHDSRYNDQYGRYPTGERRMGTTAITVLWYCLRDGFLQHVNQLSLAPVDDDEDQAHCFRLSLKRVDTDDVCMHCCLDVNRKDLIALLDRNLSITARTSAHRCADSSLTSRWFLVIDVFASWRRICHLSTLVYLHTDGLRS